MRGVILTLLAGASLTAFAGTRVNNGGGAWICRDKDAGNQIRWMRLVDLFEGKKELGLTIPLRPGIKAWDLFLEKAQMIRANFPQLQGLMTTDEVRLKSAITFLGKEAELIKIKDGAWRVWPSPAQCEDGVLYYGQIANYTDDGRLLIARDLFYDRAFSDLHRGALYVHEYVYKGLRESLGDENSYRARLIVGTLFSDLSVPEMSAKIDAILAMPVPKNQSQGPLDPITLFCKMSVAKLGEREGTLSNAFTPSPDPGKTVQAESEGYRFVIQTEPEHGYPVSMQIEDIATGALTQLDGPMLAPAFRRYNWARVQLQSKARGTYAVLNCWASLKMY